MRRSAWLLGPAVFAGGLLAYAALAEGPPPAPQANDPVVAKVDGDPIRLSDLNDAANTMPQAQSLPKQTLYPMLLDQLIAGRALVVEAHKAGLDKDPAVQRQMQAAEDRALQSAWLHRAIDSQVTDAAVRARYDQEIAQPSQEEVHARHILVPDEATAKKVIAELNKGGDFAALSKQYSKDPGAAQQGGDLGFFKKDDMVPEFADAAFALKPGQTTQTPVHTQFGWHVIQVIERRPVQPPSFEQARDQLRQKMIQENVQKVVAQAREGVTVEKFNLDGTPMRATDTAEPPPAK
ncbi:MAG: peptidylprolyl isomerase [Acetobacteraceae bacterium]|nr:peptidylprolyl isomerase [Acetobacteraceae bacterium]